MGFNGYLNFNGTELINNARTKAYISGRVPFVSACASCTLPGSPDYWDPVTDAAPWVDPAVPWSKDFLGLLGITIGGVTVATGGRTPLSKVGPGAVMGQIKHAHREINAHAIGFALSEQGMSWGRTWITNILQAGSGIPSCQTSCIGSPMSMYAWCPDCADDPVACTSATRSMFDASILQGPEMTGERRVGLDCGRGRMWMWDADFLIGTGRPFGYQDPYVIANHVPFTVPTLWPCVAWQAHTPGSGTCTLPDCSINVFGACMVWTPVGDPACDDPCNVTGGTCLSDPLCPAPVPPPLPVTPNNPCVCLISMNPVTTMTSLPAGVLPKTGAFVPILQVSAGSDDMRRILLRFYKSPAGQPCTYANLGNCSVAGEIGIPYLPAGATLLIDGRQEQAVVTCADGRTEIPILYTTAGPMAQWPVIGCGDAWCVAVTCDGNFVAPDAWASVSVSVREDVW